MSGIRRRAQEAAGNVAARTADVESEADADLSHEEQVAKFRRKAARHRRQRVALQHEALRLAGLSDDDAKRFRTKSMPQSTLFMAEIIPVLHDLYADLPPRATRTVLDVGPQNFAGTALLAQIHARRTFTDLKLRVSAIDIVDRFALLKEIVAPNVEFIHGNVFDLEPGSFDTVIASHVVEHVPSPQKFVHQLQAVANDHVIIATPWKEKLPLTQGHVNVIDEAFVESVGGERLTVYSNYSWGKNRKVCIFVVPAASPGT